MFDQYENVLNYAPVSIHDVFQNQELVFYTFLGVFPNREVRAFSPFRKDKSPGCRFEYFDSLWWFVDNAMYKEKLYFNCVELVMYMYNLEFKEALRLISNKIKLKSEISVPTYQTVFDNKNKYDIKIKVTVKKWEENNYFSNNYGIHKDYLNLQPYYNVVDYWVSNKKSPALIKNKFGIPKNKIAYHFERDNSIKLYFPDSDIKWYSNVNEDNLFGYHRMGNYLINEDKSLFISSSGKDEIMLNYYLGANSLALQGETIYTLPEYLLYNLRWFNPIYIWMDSDAAGIRCTNRLYTFLKKVFPTKTIVKCFHQNELGKDIADIIQNKHNLLSIFKQIKHNHEV